MNNKPDNHNRQERAFIIANAAASSALEGIYPDDEMKALEERYINGDFANTHELGEHMRVYLRKKYNLK